MRPVGSAIELEKRRKDAVRRIRAGERVTDVAKDLGVRDEQGWWRHGAMEAGIEELRSRGIEVVRNISG